jgi:hypothetical protein
MMMSELPGGSAAGSALVSLAVGVWGKPASGWVEGAAILVAVLLVGTVTAANNFAAQVNFEEAEPLSVDYQRETSMILFKGCLSLFQ